MTPPWQQEYQLHRSERERELLEEDRLVRRLREREAAQRAHEEQTGEEL